MKQRINKKYLRRALLILAVTAMTGCAKTDNVPYTEARHFVLHNASNLNGNYRVDVNGTVKLMEPTFKKMYELGQADRRGNMTPAIAKERAKEIVAAQSFIRERVDGYTPAPQAKKDHVTVDEREARAFGEALAKTYLEGFNGV